MLICRTREKAGAPACALGSQLNAALGPELPRGPPRTCHPPSALPPACFLPVDDCPEGAPGPALHSYCWLSVGIDFPSFGTRSKTKIFLNY